MIQQGSKMLLEVAYMDVPYITVYFVLFDVFS